MLKTERNTQTMRERVSAAFKRWYFRGIPPQRRNLDRRAFNLTMFFDQGQWWAENKATGAQWSVVDTGSPRNKTAVDGFNFERVTDGDEAA